MALALLCVFVVRDSTNEVMEENYETRPNDGRRLMMLLFFVSQPWAQQPKEIQPNRVGSFMHAKLEHAQKVLSGLALEDYDLIAENSQALSLLSLESSWQVLQTASYVQHSNDFRQATGAMTQAAEDRNLDGATLAYVEVCMKCQLPQVCAKGTQTS
jgi:hypothetical protein